MKTGKYLNGILQSMFESTGMSKDIEPYIEELRSSIGERDKHLTQLGELKESGEDEFEFVPRETSESTSDWESKYNELKERYIDRFFNGDIQAGNVDTSISKSEIMREQNADIHSDGESKRIEELLVDID